MDKSKPSMSLISKISRTFNSSIQLQWNFGNPLSFPLKKDFSTAKNVTLKIAAPLLVVRSGESLVSSMWSSSHKFRKTDFIYAWDPFITVSGEQFDSILTEYTLKQYEGYGSLGIY